jgi:hypothetical protein
LLLDCFVSYLASAFSSDEVALVPLGTRGEPGVLYEVLDRAPAAVAWWQRSEASPNDLEGLLACGGLGPSFVGWPPDVAGPIAVLARTSFVAPRQTPAAFQVVAIVPTYNEADLIAHTLGDLTTEGLGVYLLDNWSTDGTWEIAGRFSGLVGRERFPPEGPSRTYDLRRIMTRVEELAWSIDADWCVLHDADERRRSPWPGVRLRDALYRVDRAGFTCVDHVTLNFWPTPGQAYDGTRDVEEALPRFAFSDHPGHFHQRRAWKRLDARVSLSPTAGHDVAFSGRRVYPFKFLLKHYPVRSQAHGEQKVLAERLPRWNAAERALGWHAQYDELSLRRFVRPTSELELFDPLGFSTRRLVERLSGVGVFREPPPWATPPFWTYLPEEPKLIRSPRLRVAAVGRKDPLVGFAKPGMFST